MKDMIDRFYMHEKVALTITMGDVPMGSEGIVVGYRPDVGRVVVRFGRRLRAVLPENLESLSETNPVSVRRLPGSNRFRVRTPGGIKSYSTTRSRAEAQARLLRSKENPTGRSHGYKVGLGKYSEESEMDPPLYKINFLTVRQTGSGALVHHKPAFPLQILPRDDMDVDFRFWGSARYDVHEAFPAFPSDPVGYIIWVINYSICVEGHYYCFEHGFDCRVKLSLTGMRGINCKIMKPYGQLEGLPVLPHDWQYFQFIN